MSDVHVFEEDLAWESGDENQRRWARFYRRHLGDRVSIVSGRVDDIGLQRDGCDRVVYLDDRPLYVEEKLRRKPYDDFLIEVWSQYYSEGNPANRPGWTVDPGKLTDLLAYAVKPLSMGRIVPYKPLRAAVRDSLRSWISEGHAVKRMAKNEQYNTINYSLPWELLWQAMGRSYPQLEW